MLDTLLFDVDGTLIDFDICEKNALRRAFQKNNYPFSDALYMDYSADNIKMWKKYELGLIDRDTVVYTRFTRLFERFGIDGDGASFEDEYIECLSDEYTLIDGALQLMEKLCGNCRMYVVTNGIASAQNRRLLKSGLARYMDGIFISEDIGAQKPKKEFFDRVFSRIGTVDPARTLIIGDSLSSDIKGGNNAGILSCWYNPKRKKPEPGFKIDFEINSLDELCGLIGRGAN